MAETCLRLLHIIIKLFAVVPGISLSYKADTWQGIMCPLRRAYLSSDGETRVSPNLTSEVPLQDIVLLVSNPSFIINSLLVHFR